MTLKHDPTDAAIQSVDDLTYVQDRLRSALRRYKQEDQLSDATDAREVACQLLDCVRLLVSDIRNIVDREVASRVLADMKNSPAPCGSGTRGTG